MHNKQSWLKRLLIVALFGAGFAGGLYYYYKPTAGAGIYEFQESRDLQSILDLFDKNWYWLTPQSKEEYDPAPTFKYRSPSQLPSEAGKLNIKVLYENDTFVGFIAYHKEQFYSGRILFITVKPEFRSKGYGARLLDYAVKDLRERGANVIRILTRPENYSGQALYKKLGFKEDWRNEKFVEFIRYYE